MRLAMDRHGSSLSLSQLVAREMRAVRAPAGRRAAQLDQKRRRTARIALTLGVMACAASLGVLAGELARAGLIR